MNYYVCQAESNCERVQSAVCLHCQRRLCLEHLAEHSSITLNRFGELSNEVRLTYEQLKVDCEKRRDTVEQQFNSFHQWYNEQKVQLEQFYEQGLKSIQSRREFFIDEEFKLAQQLEQHAFQPLKELQDQGVVNTELINQIQDTINKTRETNSALQQVLTPSAPQPQPRIQIQEKSDGGVPHRKLFLRFSNLESIPKSRRLIRAYIEVKFMLIEMKFVYLFFYELGSRSTYGYSEFHLFVFNIMASKSRETRETTTFQELFFNYSTSFVQTSK